MLSPNRLRESSVHGLELNADRLAGGRNVRDCKVRCVLFRVILCRWLRSLPFRRTYTVRTVELDNFGSRGLSKVVFCFFIFSNGRGIAFIEIQGFRGGGAHHGKDRPGEPTDHPTTKHSWGSCTKRFTSRQELLSTTSNERVMSERNDEGRKCVAGKRQRSGWIVVSN